MNFKSINNTMKKMLLCQCANVYYRMCLNMTFTVQNKPAAVANQRKPSPIISSFLNWAEENCRCSQNLYMQKMLANRNPATFVNGLLGFITLGIYTPLEARVYCSHCNELLHRYEQLYLHHQYTLLLPVVFA